MRVVRDDVFDYSSALMAAELLFFILSTIALVFGLVITRWIHSRYGMDIIVRRYGVPVNNQVDFPLISILVPARNEERNIERCVNALLAQTYPHFELIVVDDRSSDSTWKILEAMIPNNSRLRLVQGVDIVPGWAGKPHALTQGVKHAKGEWLCFVDADTFAAPELIVATYLKAQEYHADLFSILTTQESEMWEGWTKNIYLGLRDRLGLLLLGATLGLLGAILLPFWLLLGVLWYFSTVNLFAGLIALHAVILWLYLLWTRVKVNKAFQISPCYAFTLPVGALVFTAMMFVSAWKVLTGRGVTWKGRRYGQRQAS